MSRFLEPNRSGSHVLVADDDYFVQRCSVALLRQLGHDGVVVGDGQQAIDCLATRPFALMLLDVSMPVLDGLATLAAVRRGEAMRRDGRRQRIVMVTAHAEPGDIARLRAAGADGYIAKPIDPQRFRDEVQRVLAT